MRRWKVDKRERNIKRRGEELITTAGRRKINKSERAGKQ